MWYRTYSEKPGGVWDRTAEDTMLEFAETIHPMSVLPVSLKEVNYEAKEGSKKTIHFNGSEQNVDLILRTVMSANQLSIYGAVADIDPLETMEIPTSDPGTDEQRRGNLLQEYGQQFEQLFDAQKLSKLCSNAGLKTVERRQYFIALDTERRSGMVHLCRELRCRVTI